MWHEPLLLMAGHLAIYNRSKANELVRSILNLASPYEEMLQRDTLLAADCLADDIYLQPRLRDEVLDKLAKLLEHLAPQVRRAALEHYENLTVTSHRQAAAASLRRVYALDEMEDFDAIANETRLNLATALVHLGELDTAQPLLWPLDDEKREPSRSEVQLLRFKGWKDTAADYLLQLQKGKNFRIGTNYDLAKCSLGPVNAETARRTLGETGLRDLIAELIEHTKDEADRAALRWIAALIPKVPSTEEFIALTEPDVPVRIRRMAAKQLLDGEYHTRAVKMLRGIATSEPDQAASATEILLEADETAGLEQGLLRDTALLANDANASQAIGTLMQMGDTDFALAAALHLLTTGQLDYGRDRMYWEVVENLIAHEHNELGSAAARWLALRPGFSYRLQACEALLESKHIAQTVPLLQYLAYEQHDDAGQRACELLLKYKEAEKVHPLLARTAKKANPRLQYQAALALALTNRIAGLTEERVDRAELKLAILDERTHAYEEALNSFCQIGLSTLAALEFNDAYTDAAQELGRMGLNMLMGNVPATPEQLTELLYSPAPAMNVNAALFSLRMGKVQPSRERLSELLTMPQSLSLPVRRQALRTLSRIADTETVSLIVHLMNDKDSTIRENAVQAMGKLGDVTALSHLITTLTDENGLVRGNAAQALGELEDATALSHLITALTDENGLVRGNAAQALGELGDAAALSHLITALTDENIWVRWNATQALGELGDATTLPHLITALSDEDDRVCEAAAQALSALGDVTALSHFIITLNGEDKEVRQNAAKALDTLGDAAALSHLITALDDEDNGVRRNAAYALAR